MPASAPGRGVAAQAAPPDGLGQADQEEGPYGLDAKPLHREVDPLAPGQDGGGEVGLVEEGEEAHHVEDGVRKQVQREDLSPEERLDGHREDDEPLDLEEPEGEEAEAVRDAELDDPGHGHGGNRERGPQLPPPAGKLKVPPEERQGHEE